MLLFSGPRIGENAKAEELESGDGRTKVYVYLTPTNYRLKMVETTQLMSLHVYKERGKRQP